MRVSAVQDSAEPKRIISSDRLFVTLAITGLVSSIALIMVGSIVRVTGYGLGCPDWPLCHGQAIPPFLASAWVEFAHRLFGGLVVIQIGALVYLSWKYYRAELWIIGPAMLITVVTAIQVVLGGIHVIYELPRWTGWIHTSVAMLVAGLLAVWVAVSQSALENMGRAVSAKLEDSPLFVWTNIVAGASYLVILTGSLVTRTGASLVCPSFPHCGLETVPDNLQTIVAFQMIHRVFAVTIGVSVVFILWRLYQASGDNGTIRFFAWVMTGLVSLQFALGMINIWYSIPMWSRVLHLGTATTIWVLIVILASALWRGREHTAEPAV